VHPLRLILGHSWSVIKRNRASYRTFVHSTMADTNLGITDDTCTCEALACNADSNPSTSEPVRLKFLTNTRGTNMNI
jgi:hypothetical protein